MKKTIVILSLFWVVFSTLKSQNNYYWVKFKDKNNSPYSLNNPNQFLSSRSVDRRITQHLLLDSTDLPITEKYIDSIRPFLTELKHRLKWLNVVVVKIDVPEYLDSIRHFSFVDSIGGIEFFPARSLTNKFSGEHLVELNQTASYATPYGAAYQQINMLNADLLHQMGFNGKGKIIALFDNGFHNVGTNPAFNAVRNNIFNTWDYVNNEADVYNEGDHGAQTFSCIGASISDKYLGTAPTASFILNHTEDNSAEWIMEEYNWEAAAEVSDSAGADIFSTSLGYTTFDDGTGDHYYQDLTGDKTVITHAGNMAYKKGIVVLNSAGNEGGAPWHYISSPADGDDVLAIGAVDSAERVTNFSGRGPNFAGRIKPDICARGAKSAVVNSLGFIANSDGTSFSCPIMAGCFASLWSAFPDRSAQDIRDAVMISADNFWTPDNNHGYGIPNFYNAYWLLKTNYNEKIIYGNDGVTIFPNPFFDELNVSLYATDLNKTSHKIEIFNLIGELLLSHDVFLAEGTFQLLRLDEVKQLQTGEYLVRLDGEKKNTYRVVKLK